MPKLKLAVFMLLFAALLVPFKAGAAAVKAGPRHAPVLMGNPPVNVNIASAGTLPKGVFFSALNASFSDKDRAKDGGDRGPDVFAQVWLLKLRYGLPGNFELASVASYANMSRRNSSAVSGHIEGYGDQSLGLSYGLFNVHQGDPCSLSFGLSALIPTAPEGSNHIPGNSAWGWRAHAAFGKWLSQDLKFDSEVVLNAPFERGNQDVKRGQQYMLNSQLRYLFKNFDLALESSLIKAESGDKRLPGGSTVNLRNGYTEWYLGPSVNVALHPGRVWLGAGVFFPLYQDVKGPTKVDDVRFDFKIGVLW